MALEYYGFTNFSKPVVADFDWVNQELATAVDDTYGIYMYCEQATGFSDWRILKKAAPSTPYSVTVLMTPPSYYDDGKDAGLILRQSSDGKLISFGYWPPAPAGGTVTWRTNWKQRGSSGGVYPGQGWAQGRDGRGDAGRLG